MEHVDYNKSRLQVFIVIDTQSLTLNKQTSVRHYPLEGGLYPLPKFVGIVLMTFHRF